MLAMPPWNFDGLFVKKSWRLPNRQIPFGSVSAITLRSIFSKAAPKRIECLPFV